MAYIGRQLVRGQNRILDDISSSFNGSTTAFNLTVSSSSSPPASVNQLWIILGGVLQKPGTDFTVADAVITFTTAPASTLSFWGMIQGDTSDINSPADASVTPSKIANSGDFAFPADVRFKDADGSHYVGLQAPSTVSSNLVWSLPAADGSANQLLKTDGSGNLGWASDTQSNLLDEDNMSSNSATQPASQQSIKAYADTKAVLTGSTNNTITTVTGANAIQGEANLTFDGTKFLLGGVTLSSSNERPLQVHSVDGPKIAIGRNDTSITDGNTIGGLEFYGNDADGTFVNTAAIIVNADGTHGNNDKPTRMQFYTTADDASSATEKLRITSAGVIGANTTSPITDLHTNYRAVQNHNYGVWSTDDGGASFFSNNAYTNTSGNWVRIANDHAMDFGMDDGNFYFRSVGAGTGNITWNLPLTITAAGKIHSENAVQSGGNTTGGFQFDAVDTACVLGIQQPSSGADTNAAIQVYDGASNNLRINYSGLIKTSEGIDFSGAQTNLAGMSSETLDSYEEGTFTPTFNNLDIPGHVTVDHYRYTKIGRLVHIEFQFSVSASINDASGFQFTLPFGTFGNTNINIPCVSNKSSGAVPFSFIHNVNGTQIIAKEATDDYSTLTYSHFSGDVLIGGGTYETDA